MIEIRPIDRAHKGDVRLPNEPFPLWGRLLPAYSEGRWRYSVREFDQDERGEMCFPDEDYDWESMSGDTLFLGAYEGEQCVGLAVLQRGFFRYLYLADLKVKRSHRRRGVSARLMEKAGEAAREQGLMGVYTIAQDNNLSACLFYLKTGFRIGGLDTEVHNGTAQQGKADILFYLDV